MDTNRQSDSQTWQHHYVAISLSEYNKQEPRMKGKWSVVLLHSEICRIRFAKQDLPLVNVCGLGLAPWLVTLSVICPTAFLGIKIRLMGLWLSRCSFKPSCRWVSHGLTLSHLGLPQFTRAASKWWRAALWAPPPAPSVPLSGSHLAPQIVQF